jgi:hypothetical protein
MPVPLAHVAGVPVEETLAFAGPVLAAACSVAVLKVQARRDRRQARRRARRGQGRVSRW